MIHIITHAYAGNLPQYAAFLRAQISSIVQSTADVTLSICYNKDDRAVVDVIHDFAYAKSFYFHEMSRGELFCRSIGRNRAASALPLDDNDLVWFTDCDHVFGPRCFPSLNQFWKTVRVVDAVQMVYPRQIQIHKTHEIGDQFWQKHLNSAELIDIDPNDFEAKTYNRPIGGVQIVRGGYVKEYGYLRDNADYQTPTDGLKPFPSFRDDVIFRKELASRGQIWAIYLLDLYRLRHTKTTYQGQDHVAMDQEKPA